VKVTFLGTGTSHGIPMIGCDCEICTSNDPRDKRTRVSLTVTYDDGHTILIDTTPELRMQCLANDVRRCDAVLFTHHHADHITGLDDLRRFNWIQGGPIECYGPAATIHRVTEMFDYAFTPDPHYPSAKPELIARTVDGAFELFGKRIVPVPLFHGQMPILGYRFDDFAYCTDCSVVPDEAMALLDGLDVRVLDALRIRPHPTHFNLDQAVECARRIGARRTLFTHIAHELMHGPTNRRLPEGMALAYDGLQLVLPEPRR